MPHIELVKNNGKPYLRIAESRYIKEIGRQKKFILKNLGSLSKFDDGQPNFLERFREKLGLAQIFWNLRNIKNSWTKIICSAILIYEIILQSTIWKNQTLNLLI